MAEENMHDYFGLILIMPFFLAILLLAILHECSLIRQEEGEK